jgi:hypothetical protein
MTGWVGSTFRQCYGCMLWWTHSCILIISLIVIRQNLNIQRYLFDRMDVWFNRTLVLVYVSIINYWGVSSHLPISLSISNTRDVDNCQYQYSCWMYWMLTAIANIKLLFRNKQNYIEINRTLGYSEPFSSGSNQIISHTLKIWSKNQSHPVNNTLFIGISHTQKIRTKNQSHGTSSHYNCRLWRSITPRAAQRWGTSLFAMSAGGGGVVSTARGDFLDWSRQPIDGVGETDLDSVTMMVSLRTGTETG